MHIKALYLSIQNCNFVFTIMNNVLFYFFLKKSVFNVVAHGRPVEFSFGLMVNLWFYSEKSKPASMTTTNSIIRLIFF